MIIPDLVKCPICATIMDKQEYVGSAILAVTDLRITHGQTREPQDVVFLCYQCGNVQHFLEIP